MSLAQEEIPEALLLGLLLELCDDRDNCFPTCNRVVWQLRMRKLRSWKDFFLYTTFISEF